VLDGAIGLDESVDSLPLIRMLGPALPANFLPRPSLFPRPPPTTPTQQSGSQKTPPSISLAQHRTEASQGGKETLHAPHPFLSSATDRRRRHRRWGRGRRRGRGRGTRSSARAPRPASTTSRRCSPASSRRARTPAPPTPQSSRNSSTRCSASGAPSSARPPLHLRSRYLPLLLHFAFISPSFFFFLRRG
jgi:hypothetical protein